MRKSDDLCHYSHCRQKHTIRFHGKGYCDEHFDLVTNSHLEKAKVV